MKLTQFFGNKSGAAGVPSPSIKGATKATPPKRRKIAVPVTGKGSIESFLKTPGKVEDSVARPTPERGSSASPGRKEKITNTVVTPDEDATPVDSSSSSSSSTSSAASSSSSSSSASSSRSSSASSASGSVSSSSAGLSTSPTPQKRSRDSRKGTSIPPSKTASTPVVGSTPHSPSEASQQNASSPLTTHTASKSSHLPASKPPPAPWAGRAAPKQASRVSAVASGMKEGTAAVVGRGALLSGGAQDVAGGGGGDVSAAAEGASRLGVGLEGWGRGVVPAVFDPLMHAHLCAVDMRDDVAVATAWGAAGPPLAQVPCSGASDSDIVACLREGSAGRGGRGVLQWNRSSGRKDGLTQFEKQVVDIKRGGGTTVPTGPLLDTIVAYENGYRYCFYGRDAAIAAPILSIYFAAKEGDPFGACSVPTQRIDLHVDRLVQCGYKVAVVQQVDHAALRAGANDKGLFRRDVVRVASPATWAGAPLAGGEAASGPSADGVSASSIRTSTGVYRAPPPSRADGRVVGLFEVSLSWLAQRAASRMGHAAGEVGALSGEWDGAAIVVMAATAAARMEGLVFDMFVDTQLRPLVSERLAAMDPSEVLVPTASPARGVSVDKEIRSSLSARTAKVVGGLGLNCGVLAANAPAGSVHAEALPALAAAQRDVADALVALVVRQLEGQVVTSSTVVSAVVEAVGVVMGCVSQVGLGSSGADDGEVSTALGVAELGVRSLMSAIRDCMLRSGVQLGVRRAVSFAQWGSTQRLRVPAATQSALDVFVGTAAQHDASVAAQRRGTLLSLVDKCITKGGRRRLRQILAVPFGSRTDITARQRASRVLSGDLVGAISCVVPEVGSAGLDCVADIVTECRRASVEREYGAAAGLMLDAVVAAVKEGRLGEDLEGVGVCIGDDVRRMLGGLPDLEALCERMRSKTARPSEVATCVVGIMRLATGLSALGRCSSHGTSSRARVADALSTLRGVSSSFVAACRSSLPSSGDASLPPPPPTWATTTGGVLSCLCGDTVGRVLRVPALVLAVATVVNAVADCLNLDALSGGKSVGTVLRDASEEAADLLALIAVGGVDVGEADDAVCEALSEQPSQLMDTGGCDEMMVDTAAGGVTAEAIKISFTRLRELMGDIEAVESAIHAHLSVCRKIVGVPLDYKTVGLDTHLLEVPPNVTKRVPTKGSAPSAVNAGTCSASWAAAADRLALPDPLTSSTGAWVKVNVVKAGTRYRTPFVIAALRVLDALRVQQTLAASDIIKQVGEVLVSGPLGRAVSAVVATAAELDVVQSLSSLYDAETWCYPRVRRDAAVLLRDLRNPLLLLGGISSSVSSVVPNSIAIAPRGKGEGDGDDVDMEVGGTAFTTVTSASQVASFFGESVPVLSPDATPPPFVVLTGANMGGKSSLLRAVAIAVLLSHIGAPVPAVEAEMGVLDGVYVRAGAGDNVLLGESTFFVEAKEVAAVVRSATARSLVLLDEFGRGTSTLDGAALATSTLRALTQSLQCGGMFVTHFPSVAEFAEHDGVGVACMQSLLADQDEDETDASGSRVVFTYRAVSGRASSSLGVEVAKLAGLPSSILAAAQVRSDQLEKLRLSLSGTATACGRLRAATDTAVCMPTDESS